MQWDQSCASKIFNVLWMVIELCLLPFFRCSLNYFVISESFLRSLVQLGGGAPRTFNFNYHIMFAYFLKGIWAAVDILLSYWVTMSCVQSIVFTCKLQTKGPKCEQCIWCCLILGRSVSWHPLNCVPEGSWFYQGDLWGTKQLLQLLNASEGNLYCLMKLSSKMVGNVLQT